MLYKTDTMNIPPAGSPERAAAINGLAVIGFIALVVVGISLAIYSTRFVPNIADGIGSAAVYLGSVFTPAPKPDLSVVTTPVASTTISFGQATTTIATTIATTTATTIATTTATSTPRTSSVPTAGTRTSGTYRVGTGAAITPYGLPDLIVTVSAIGYLSTATADSFIPSATVPTGNRPALKFTIKNIGTNWTGTWRFSATIPAQGSFLFESPIQQSLAPGESIDYTLGFDLANTGASQLISLTANFDRAVAESNATNNSISATFTVL